jgi:mixed-linked glucan synthase
VNLLTKKGIHFRVTSKQTAADDNDKFADLYDFRWVPMLFPSVVVLIFNVGAIGVAIGKTVVYFGVWTAAQKKHAAMGLLFNIWVMFLLYPFALAIMGRWAKRPVILIVLLPVIFVLVALLYVGLHILLGGIIAF